MKNQPTLPAVSDAQQSAGNRSEDRMYAAIYGAIMEHRLPAGTRLVEQALADIYKTERYNVRRVLVRLAADGLVDLKRNRGAFIASPGEKEAREMFELRQMLELSVISKAASHARASDFMDLRELVSRERDAYMQGNRPLWIRLSADFHIELARLSDNMLVVDTLRRLVSRTTLMISTAESTGQHPCSFDEHLAVVDALDARDACRAHQAMSDHLERCACRMLHRGEKRFDLRTALGQPDAHEVAPKHNIEE